MMKNLSTCLAITMASLTACSSPQVAYECACDATFEDDVRHYEETYEASVCDADDADFADVELTAEVECELGYEDAGYYNASCSCICDTFLDACG